MPRGSAPGERRGGRKAGTPNKKSLQSIEEVREKFPGWSPLMFLASVATDETMFIETRIQAAAKAAPFFHPKPRGISLNPDQFLALIINANTTNPPSQEK